MLSAWHVPSATGDFELKVHPEDEAKCLLVVEDPTPSEIDKLIAFKKRCNQYKWIDPLAGINREGRTEIVIDAPLSKCGKHLAKEAMPDRGRITAITSKDGTILAVTTSDEPDEEKKLEAAAADEKAETAVTTKRPTKCCPNPIEGPLVRSSRVLRKFCTPQQWKDWCEHGWLICYGHLSGHAYRLVHRHHPAAKVQGKICYDLDDRQTLHAYDWSTPPAEEVLTFKIILENCEPWLRCEASGFGPWKGRRGDGRSIGFIDPSDNGGMEGTWDAAVFRWIGEAVAGARFGSDLVKIAQGEMSPDDLYLDGLNAVTRDVRRLGFNLGLGAPPPSLGPRQVSVFNGVLVDTGPNA